MTVISINPVHSVLYLVLTFVSSSVLIITLGAEFLGILLVIVYVGAIAVLFLFIVMMLNIEEQKQPILFGSYSYIISSLLLTILLSKILSNFVYGSFGLDQYHLFVVYTLPFHIQFTEWVNNLFVVDNIVTIGFVLYTYYYQLLFLSGFILLLAMIASISLTLAPRELASGIPTRYQDKYEQLTRTIDGSVKTSVWNQIQN